MAQIPVFSPFSGAVTIGGVTAPTTTDIDVYVGTEVMPRATATMTAAGAYEVLLEGAEADVGKAVTFKVDGVTAVPTPANPLFARYEPQTVNLVVAVGPIVDEPTAEDGFASIAPFLETAYGFKAGEGTDGWTVYNPLWPSQSNSLQTLHVGRGYWVYVSQECILQYGSSTYSLDAGWNLIGWMPQL